MPEEGIDYSENKELLSSDEIVRLTRIFVGLGVNKLRLTGGEPFVRKDIQTLLERLTEVIPNIHITTNATMLDSYFELLKKIKIANLNISIDSLDRDRFFMITRRDAYDKVMNNIIACLAHSISIKLNCVVMKGVNDMEIVDFVKFGIKHNVEVRFIEAMPFNDDDGNKDVFMPATEIFALIMEQWSTAHKLDTLDGSSSDLYEIQGGYRFGIIPSYSRSLCGTCNRIRLTPKGQLMTCLYAQSGPDLKSMLRDTSISDQEIVTCITGAISRKKKSGFEEEAMRQEDVFRSMTTIGG